MDNSQTHKGGLLDERQKRQPRLRTEYFPVCAPELNPDEGVWSLAKRKLANDCPNDMDESLVQLLTALRELRRTPKKLRGCIRQSSLPPFLR